MSLGRRVYGRWIDRIRKDLNQSILVVTIVLTGKK
jgi:hypothetical protein